MIARYQLGPDTWVCDDCVVGREVDEGASEMNQRNQYLTLSPQNSEWTEDPPLALGSCEGGGGGGQRSA